MAEVVIQQDPDESSNRSSNQSQVETSASEFPLVSDDVKLNKPPFSYVSLISMAILQSPNQMLTLSEIYEFIRSRFSYFQPKTKALYNSIRHNLSLNDCFIQVPREKGDPGRGKYWAMHPDSNSMYDHGSFRRRRGRFIAKRQDGVSLSSSPYGRKYGVVQNTDQSESKPPKNNQKNHANQAKVSPDLFFPKPNEEKLFTDFSIEAILKEKDSNQLSNPFANLHFYSHFSN